MRRLSRRSLRHQKGLADGGRALVCAGDPHRPGRRLGLALFGGSAIMGFAALRVMFGFAEGPAYALMNKAIAHWAPDNERGMALGIGLLSTRVGSLLTAPVAVTLLLLTNDWRMMFILLGALSLLAMVLFARAFSDTPADQPRVNAAERALIRDGQQAQPIQDTPLPRWRFSPAVRWCAMRWATSLFSISPLPRSPGAEVSDG